MTIESLTIIYGHIVDKEDINYILKTLSTDSELIIVNFPHDSKCKEHAVVGIKILDASIHSGSYLDELTTSLQKKLEFSVNRISFSFKDRPMIYTIPHTCQCC